MTTALLIGPHSLRFGSENVPVTLVKLFYPFCDDCRAYHPAGEEILRQFPAHVGVVRCTAFHEGSDEAVRVLETAWMQDKFAQVLDALGERQPTWAVHVWPQMEVAGRVAGLSALILKR